MWGEKCTLSINVKHNSYTASNKRLNYSFILQWEVMCQSTLQSIMYIFVHLLEKIRLDKVLWNQVQHFNGFLFTFYKLANQEQLYG